jgi:NAD(P)-dependent dehydrogenase (short-subunit alcohol dehydrogenase family)
MANPKSIIVTGASRGIGLAIARFLLKEGHKLFLVARSGEPLEKLKGEFKGQVEYLAADLNDFKVSDLLFILVWMLSCSCCLSEQGSRFREGTAFRSRDHLLSLLVEKFAYSLHSVILLSIKYCYYFY